ncbi:hypothetical protein [Microbacterium sp.]|uniref:hypothetical protein n=1 Tax=Microbacterium sp. TaxID=51671 RepID=UPI0039E60265
MSFRTFLDNLDPVLRRISATIPTAGTVAPSFSVARLAMQTAEGDSESRGAVAPVTSAVPAQLVTTGTLRVA